VVASVGRLSARTYKAGLTTLANAGVSVARAVVSFLTIALLIRYLGRESYGLAVTITGIAAWLAVAQGGIGQSLKNQMIRQPEAAGTLFANAFATLVAIALVVGLALTAAAPWLPWKAILNDPGFDQPLLIVFSLWIVLGTAVLSLVRAAYSARQAEFRLAPAMLTGVLAAFVLVIAGVKLGWSMTAVVSASLMANLLGLGAGLFLMPRQLGIQLEWPQRLYRAGLWFFVIEVCTILIFEADLFLVNLLLGQAQAASFALHLQLFVYVETAIALVISPWWAAFGDAWKSDEREWLRSIVGRLAAVTGLLGGCGVGLMMAIGRPLMNLWSHGKVEWNPLLAMLIGVNVVIQGVAGVYAAALGSLGIARDPARVVVFQAILNICVCLWLIRRFGVVGGAAGSLGTYALTSGLYLPWKARRVIT
jgi:O-antigen/teichoic acid export membrane protein